MKLHEIEGIGASYAAKLEGAGLTHVAHLLEKGATKKGREEIAAAAGVSEKHVLTWVNHADLMRIDGVGWQRHAAGLAEGAQAQGGLRHGWAQSSTGTRWRRQHPTPLAAIGYATSAGSTADRIP